MMNNYDEMAMEFCNKYGVKVKIEFEGYKKYFEDDKQCRNVYKVLIIRNGKRMTVHFGDSIKNTEKGIEPSVYDILSCLQKYDCGSFDNFCSEYGYDQYKLSQYKKIMSIYKAVCREYKNVCRLFDDVIDELAEIC